MEDSSQKKIKIKIGETKFVFIIDGKYKVKFVSINIGVGALGQPVYILTFEVIEGEFKGCQINDMVNIHKGDNKLYGKRNKLGKIIEVLRNKPCQIGEEIYIDDLIGSICYANIIEKVKPNEKNKKTNKITSLEVFYG